MPSLFTLEGPKPPCMEIPVLAGPVPLWDRIPTWAKWMMFAGGVAGLYWVSGKAYRKLQSTSWGEERYRHSRERAFHGVTFSKGDRRRIAWIKGRLRPIAVESTVSLEAVQGRKVGRNEYEQDLVLEAMSELGYDFDGDEFHSRERALHGLGRAQLLGLKWDPVGKGMYKATSPHGEYIINGNGAGRMKWTVTYPDGDYGMTDSFREAKAWGDLHAEDRARK